MRLMWVCYSGHLLLLRHQKINIFKQKINRLSKSKAEVGEQLSTNSGKFQASSLQCYMMLCVKWKLFLSFVRACLLRSYMFKTTLFMCYRLILDAVWVCWSAEASIDDWMGNTALLIFTPMLFRYTTSPLQGLD